MSSVRLFVFALLGVAASAASGQTLGQGGSMATGGAGPSGAQGASDHFERCDSPKVTTSRGDGWVKAILLRRP